MSLHPLISTITQYFQNEADGGKTQRVIPMITCESNVLIGHQEITILS